MSYEEVRFSRDCEAVQIPQGNTVVIPSGTGAFITQSLGGSYTLQVPALGGLFRVAGGDADAVGKQPAESPASAGATTSRKRNRVVQKACMLQNRDR